MEIDLIQAILLGILQGITEFLPISSSGHLILARWVFGWEQPGLAFDVALHMGTLLGVLAYFWRDWIRVVVGVWQSVTQRSLASFEARLGWFIVLGTVPGALAGALAEKHVDAFFHTADELTGAIDARGVALVSVSLMLLGLLLFLADRTGRQSRAIEKLVLWDALVIGLAQAVAIIPGVSRSGATITMGLFRGLDRPSAARFSFLLSAPVIAGAGVKQTYEVLSAGMPSGQMAFFGAGMASAAVVGYLAIAFMLRYLERNSTLLFVVYRLALGLGILALVVMRGW